MTKLVKRYIAAVDEKNKNDELHQQMIKERHKQVALILTNEELFGYELRQELFDTIFNYYNNNKQFQEVQQPLDRASHELSVLWEIASDEEKNEIEQYFKKEGTK